MVLSLKLEVVDRVSNYPGKTVPQMSPGNTGTSLCLRHQLAAALLCNPEHSKHPVHSCSLRIVIPDSHQ